MSDLPAHPLVTFALLTYNQQDYIREAAEAALAQDYEPLEVIISDDCSSDQTLNIISDVISKYSGPHKVVLNANSTNLGLVGHVNKIAAMSSGDLIVVGAGDDISYPFRTSRLASIFYSFDKEPLLIHSSAEKISPNGKSLGTAHPPISTNTPLKLLNKAATLDSVYIGATGAWSKRLFEIFGPITYSSAYEDIVLGTRAAMLGGLVYFPAPLLKYRVGTGIATNNKKFSNLDSFVTWRKEWLETMQDVYLQRRKDGDTIGFNLRKEAMMAKLNLYIARRKLYQGTKTLMLELTSNPALLIKSIIVETSSITIALLGRALMLIKPAVTRN